MLLVMGRAAGTQGYQVSRLRSNACMPTEVQPYSTHDGAAEGIIYLYLYSEQVRYDRQLAHSGYESSGSLAQLRCDMDHSAN